MEPISAIALSLALGAEATAGTEGITAAVKDAYDALKNLIKNRHPKASIDHLEQAPESENRRAVIEEDLSNSGAGQGAELLIAARRLTELIQQQAPAIAASIVVDLRDIEAANLRLADIVTLGTGVKLEKGRLSSDIDIRDVRAISPWPKGG
jgi:hypothetical protein